MSHPAKPKATKVKAKPKATRPAKSKTKTKADKTRVDKARRYAINVLDAYGCTVAEFRAMFAVSEATFHRYADGVRLKRRPTELPRFTNSYTDPSTWPVPVPMEAADALEIATIALLRAAERFTISEIVVALNVNKTFVYDENKALWARRGNRSPAETRMSCRYLFLWEVVRARPVERRRDARWRRERWVTRARGMVG